MLVVGEEHSVDDSPDIFAGVTRSLGITDTLKPWVFGATNGNH